MCQCNCTTTKNRENNSFFKAPKRKYKLSTTSEELRPSGDIFSSLASSLRERFQSGSQIQDFQVGQKSAEEVLVWACFLDDELSN